MNQVLEVGIRILIYNLEINTHEAALKNNRVESAWAVDRYISMCIQFSICIIYIYQYV